MKPKSGNKAYFDMQTFKVHGCGNCLWEFSSETALRLHQKVAHREAYEMRYKYKIFCGDCKREFGTEADLLEHTKTCGVIRVRRR